MGLFNRKNKGVTVDSESVSSKLSRTPSNLQTPPPNKTLNGTSPFTSPSTINVALPPPPNSNNDPAAYLRSIYAVRERSRLIHEKAKKDQLTHFDVDLTKFGDTATYLVSIIKVYIQSVPHNRLLAHHSLARLCPRLPHDSPPRTMATL